VVMEHGSRRLIHYNVTAHPTALGIIFMAAGVVVSAIGAKKTVMICPNCAWRGRTLSSWLPG
jgi:hypothetical protein